jgi:hypothetical protein
VHQAKYSFFLKASQLRSSTLFLCVFSQFISRMARWDSRLPRDHEFANEACAGSLDQIFTALSSPDPLAPGFLREMSSDATICRWSLKTWRTHLLKDRKWRSRCRRDQYRRILTDDQETRLGGMRLKECIETGTDCPPLCVTHLGC